MRNPLLIPELRELLQEGKHDDLRTVLTDLHPNDAASILSGLEDPEIVEVMSIVPLEVCRDVFEYFEPELQERIVLGTGRDRVKALLTALPSDERAEFLERLDERVRHRFVPLLAKAAREDLLRREQFEDDQVGSILSTEYCVLKKHMTAPEAIAELRRQEPNRETIYYSYVVDDEGRLIGFVSLRDLITARDDETVEKLMKAAPVSILATADQEEAAKAIREYDLLALPIVDEHNKLVGIITYDDAADIQEEEGTEDIEKMAGISGEPEAVGYIEESVLSQIRRRSPLICILAVAYVVTAYVIHENEGSLGTGSDVGLRGVLVALLPGVMATGGMVGTQASSLVIRGLTVGDLHPRAFAAVLWKELRVSAVLALVLAMIVFLQGLVIGSEDMSQLMLIACLGPAIAMAAHVTIAALLGAAIPLVAEGLGRDPAMVSTPAVTWIADLSGATIYFITVGAILAASS